MKKSEQKVCKKSSNYLRGECQKSRADRLYKAFLMDASWGNDYEVKVYRDIFKYQEKVKLISHF